MTCIYFDNSATTKMDNEVLNEVDKYSISLYANPASMHRLGYFIESDVNSATDIIAKSINAERNEIIFTSGGSESNNFAIKGAASAYKRRGNKIITTTIEHASVTNCVNSLIDDGFDVTYLSVDGTGHINLDELRDSIDDRTLLVSIMYVNNEIGSVQNIKEIGKLIKEKNKDTIFHVDAVQAFGKYKIDVKDQNIDLLSVSSHKFYGPKGAGFLYKKKDIRLIPLIYGGGQQQNLRSGTLNVPGIMGTALATKLIYKDIIGTYNYLFELKKYTYNLLLILKNKYDIININSKLDESFAPHILSVSFTGIRAEVMLHALESDGIFVSAGSACSSHDKKVSNTLSSIGLLKENAESTIRISFGKYNTKEEVDEFIEVIDKLIPRLLLKK